MWHAAFKLSSLLLLMWPYNIKNTTEEAENLIFENFENFLNLYILHFRITFLFDTNFNYCLSVIPGVRLLYNIQNKQNNWKHQLKNW